MMEERLPQQPSSSHEPSASQGRPSLDGSGLQILATEHWSLLATRSLSWNEAFSRTSLFLTVLTGAVVALALAAEAMSFGSGWIAFALVLLPAVLFIGLATYIRLLEVNVEDVVWVAGMNRLRHAYLESRPDLATLFVTSPFDDPRGVSVSLGAQALPHTGLHALVTTPGMVAVVDAIVAAVCRDDRHPGRRIPEVMAAVGDTPRGAISLDRLIGGRLWPTLTPKG
jgi:hypothetical protein